MNINTYIYYKNRINFNIRIFYMVNRKYTSRKRRRTKRGRRTTKRGGRRRKKTKKRRKKGGRKSRGGQPQVGIWLTVKKWSKIRNRFKYLSKKKKKRRK